MPETRFIPRPPRVDPLLTSLALAAGITAISVIAARHCRQQHIRKYMCPCTVRPSAADIPAEPDTGADVPPATPGSPTPPATSRQP